MEGAPVTVTDIVSVDTGLPCSSPKSLPEEVMQPEKVLPARCARALADALSSLPHLASLFPLL